jgi:hypothetical protein
MIGRIGVVSHHLRSLVDAIELNVLCAFVCVVECFDAHIIDIMVYNRRFDLLASLTKCNQLFKGNQITNEFAFIIISSAPSLKNVAQIKAIVFGQINLFSSFFIFLP